MESIFKHWSHTRFRESVYVVCGKVLSWFLYLREALRASAFRLRGGASVSESLEYSRAIERDLLL